MASTSNSASTSIESTSFPTELKLKFISSDGVHLEANCSIVKKSKNMQSLLNNLEITDVKDPRLDEPMNLPIVEEALKMIIEWCETNKDFVYEKDEETRISLTFEDKKFCSRMNNGLIMDVIMGATFLEIDELLDVITQYLADRVAYFNADQMREFFMLPDDRTPSQKEQLAREYKWITEP